MRYVFVDEAGISEEEHTTVVVGILVDADKELMRAERLVKEVNQGIPELFKKDFWFHAKDIWGNKKYRESWSMADRMTTLKLMMSIPRKLNLPIAMARIRRDADNPHANDDSITRAQLQHIMAFSHCMAQADRYIRNYGDPDEVGTVVAEDIPDMRRHLNNALNYYRETPYVFSPGSVIPTQEELLSGKIIQNGDIRVSRLRSSVHFIPKGGDVLLQVADACAFAFRRFFSEQSFGEEFIQSMGLQLNKEDYKGPSSYMLYYFHPKMF